MEKKSTEKLKEISAAFSASNPRLTQKMIDEDRRKARIIDKIIKSREKSQMQKIIDGEIIPEFSYVDYSTPEAQAELDKVLKQKKKILEKKNVDWDELNKFKITI